LYIEIVDRPLFSVSGNIDDSRNDCGPDLGAVQHQNPEEIPDSNDEDPVFIYDADNDGDMHDARRTMRVTAEDLKVISAEILVMEDQASCSTTLRWMRAVQHYWKRIVGESWTRHRAARQAAKVFWTEVRLLL
jgi:hypothetical protein